MELKNNLKTILGIGLCCILFLSMARFIYSIDRGNAFLSLTYSESLYNTHKLIENGDIKYTKSDRRWGPLFPASVSTINKIAPTRNPLGLNRLCFPNVDRSMLLDPYGEYQACQSYKSFIWRISLLIAYGTIIYFLLIIILDFQFLLKKNRAS